MASNNNFNVQVGVQVNTNQTQVQNQINKSAKNVKVNADLNLKLDKNILNNRINSYLSQNTRLGEEFRSKLQNIQSQISAVNRTSLNSLTKEFREASTAATSLGQTGKTVFGKFRQDIGNFLTFVTAGGLIVNSINSIKDMVVNVAELDNQLLELSKVSDLTADGLARVTEEAYNLGETVGKTGTTTLSAITDFVRAGYELKDAMNLAEQALIMVNVSENIKDAGVAAENLVHIMNGLGEGASYASTIVDAINEVSNTQAVDFDNLVDGATRLSAVAKQSGVSFEEMLGILTAGYATLGDMEKVATGAITIFTRLQSIQLDGEDGVKTVAKLQETFSDATNGVVNIVDKTTGQLRSAFDILNDLSTVWDSLDSNTQSALAFEAAGTRQKNVLLSVVDNWDLVKESVDSASDSLGSSAVENEKYLNSLAGKTSQFKSQYEELSQVVVDGDFLKYIVDGGTGALKILTELIDSVGLFKIGLIATFATIGTKTGAFSTLIGQIQMLLLAQTNYTVSTVGAALAQVGFTGAIQATATAMKTFLLTNPVGWAIIAATAIVSLKEAYDYFNVTLEENQQKLSDLKAEYDSLTSEVSTLEEQISSVRTKMKELQELKPLTFTNDEEYQKLYNTNEELERQLTIQQELQKIAGKNAEEIAIDTINTKSEPSLVKTEDSYSNSGATTPSLITREEAIGERIDAYNKLTIQLDEYKNKQLELAKSGQTESKEYKKLADQIDSINSKRDEYYKYVLETTQAIDNEGKSIIGATSEGKTYANNIDNIDSKVNNFIDSVNSTENAVNGLTISSEEASNATAQTAEEIAKAAEEALQKTNDVIDSYQSSIKSITTALSDTSNLSSSDLIDLMQEFSDFDWSAYGVTGAKGIGDLDGALNALGISLRSSLDDTLQFNPALQKFYQETMNASEGITVFSDSISSTEQKSEEFYDAVLTNLSESITQQSELYNINFKEYKSLIEAKQALDEEYARQQQLLVNAQMNFQQVMYSGDVEKIKQLGLEYANVQKSFNDYFGLTTDFSTSVDLTNDTYKKDKVELPEEYVSKKADLEHRRNMGLSDVLYYSELQGLEKDYLAGHKEYQSEIWSIDEAIYKHKQDLSDQAKKDAEDSIKSKFGDLDYNYAMGYGGIKTEEDYQKQKWELAKKYYWNVEGYEEEWRQAQQDWHKYNIEQTQNEIDKIEKLRLDSIDKIISKYSELRDAINNTASSQTGDAQINTYSDGIKSANQAIKYIQGEINKLNKKEITATFTQDDYDSQLTTLQSALSDAYSSIDDFNKSIAESIQQDQEDIFKAFESGYEKEQKYWEDQKDAYSDIIDAQKEILQLKKEQNDYEKTIAEKTKGISSIESRMADLQRAASTGDRQANTELKKLEEDLAKQKEDLADTQADHEYDLANDALDQAKEDNDKISDLKLEAIKTEYETQRSSQEELFKQLTELITKQKNFTISEYSSAIDEIAKKMAENGIVLGEDYINGLKGVQAQPNNNANGIYSILGKKSSAPLKVDTSLSTLNQELAKMGYSSINTKKMVQLAQALGLTDIDNVNEVGTDELGKLNKNRILAALKAAGFSSGGTIGKSSSNGLLSDLIKLSGENVLIPVRTGEGVLTEAQNNAWLKLVPQLTNLSNVMTNFKIPDFHNFVTNNNSSSPTVSITIPIAGNADSSTVTALNNASNNIAQQVAKALINVSRTK